MSAWREGGKDCTVPSYPHYFMGLIIGGGRGRDLPKRAALDDRWSLNGQWIGLIEDDSDGVLPRLVDDDYSTDTCVCFWMTVQVRYSSSSGLRNCVVNSPWYHATSLGEMKVVSASSCYRTIINTIAGWSLDNLDAHHDVEGRRHTVIFRRTRTARTTHGTIIWPRTCLRHLSLSTTVSFLHLHIF